MKYTYDTGKIERDFVLKKVEGTCDANPERATLIGVMCRACPHFNGMKTFYVPSKYLTNKADTFVLCKFHKKDDEGTSEIIRKMYEDFREEALRHFDD